MRRRILVPAAALCGALVMLPMLSATAAAPTPHLAGEVTGVTGTPVDVALLPSGARGYIVDGGDTVDLFDPAVNAVTGSSVDFVTNGWGLPRDLSPAFDGSRVYAATEHWLITLNPDGTLDQSFGTGPSWDIRAIAAVPGGASVMGVSDTATASLYRFNLGLSFSLVPFGAAPAPDALTDVAVGTDSRVYASGRTGGAGVLYIFADPFALAGPAHVVALTGSTGTAGVAVSPDGSRAAVAAPAQNAVYLVDTAAGTLTATVTTPGPPQHVVFSPDGTTVYATGGADVTLIDAASGTLAATVSGAGGDLRTAAPSPSGNRLWVADAQAADPAVRMLSSSTVTGPAASSTATAGSAFSTAFTASRFDLPVTWSVSPALPTGLSLNAVTGVVGGTPTTAGPAAAYTLTATSADGDSAATSWSLQVAAASPTPGTPTVLPPTGTETPWLLLGAAAAAIALGAAMRGVRRATGRRGR